MRRFTIAIAFAAILATSSPLSAQCNNWSQNFQSGELLSTGGQVGVLQGHVYLFGLGSSNTLIYSRFDGARWSPLDTIPGVHSRAVTTYDMGSGPRMFLAGLSPVIGHEVASFDGTSWTDLAPGLSGASGSGPTEALAVLGFDDGSGPALYVGGDFSSPSLGIIRWNGTTWSPVGAGLNGQVNCLAVYDEGSGPRLFAGGYFTSPAGRVARWDGTSWTAVGGGATGGVDKMCVANVGGIPALFTATSGSTFNGIVQRWDGTTWTPISPTGTYGAGAISGFDDGTGMALYASFPRTTGMSRWDGTTWSVLPGPPMYGVTDLVATPQVLYIAAKYREVAEPTPGQRLPGLIAWKGVRTDLPAGVDKGIPTGQAEGGVHALRVHDDGTGPALYAGGSFAQAGDLAAGCIARWDGGGWSTLGAGLGQAYLDRVRALEVFDDGSGGGQQLYAGGRFQPPGMPITGLAKWDGSTWQAIPGSPTGIYALAGFDDGTGPALYAAGDFSAVWSGEIARWNGTSWAPVAAGVWGPMLNPTVTALVVHDDGSGPRLFAGGNFSHSGSLPMQGVGSWDGTSWSQVGSGLGFAPSFYVKCLAVLNEGPGPELYATGNFTEAGSAGMAKWDGSLWQPVGTGPGIYSRNMVVFDDGGGPGLFTSTETELRRFRNGAWTTIATIGPPDSQVMRPLAVYAGAGAPALYMGGRFSRIDGKMSSGFARWSSDVHGATYCFGDGTGTACPCGNASASSERAGCANPFGTGGSLRITGCAHVTSDDVVLHGSGMTNGSVMYIQGTSTIAIGRGAVFGDGLRCVGGTVVRLATMANSAGASEYPNATQTTPVSVRGMIGATGGTRTYQAWYRVIAPLCSAGNWNLTNAVSLEWAP